MTAFDSVSHAMTTIATGGFSTHNSSIGFFKSSNIEIVACIFIILGSIPFISYLKFARGNRKIFFKTFKLRVDLLTHYFNSNYVYLFIIN